MSDVEEVDAAIAEAGRDRRALVFGFGEENGELFHCRHGNVPAVVARQEGFALEIEEEECRCHFHRGRMAVREGEDYRRGESRKWAKGGVFRTRNTMELR